MDPVTMAFYGVICGALATVAPSVVKPPMRFVLGVAVGVVAALLLPLLRRAVGY